MGDKRKFSTFVSEISFYLSVLTQLSFLEKHQVEQLTPLCKLQLFDCITVTKQCM